MATIAEALATALKHHQAGDFESTKRIYRVILRLSPDQTVALHFLGVILHQNGRHDEAVDYISRALQIDPDYIAVQPCHRARQLSTRLTTTNHRCTGEAFSPTTRLAGRRSWMMKSAAQKG